MEYQRHCEEYSVLGFDCEWVTEPGYGRGEVALLQLASHRGLCVLVRLSKLKHIPTELAVKCFLKLKFRMLQIV